MHQPLFPSLMRIWMILCLLCVAAFGQSTPPGQGTSGSTTRGNHVIRGKIFLPSGRLPELRLRVVLEVASGGIFGEAFSDSVGNFEFRSLPNNNYRLVVPSDGHTYETSQENLEISGTVSRTFSVQVYLRLKESNERTSSQKMVSAAEFSQEVPKAARKSYEQGLKKLKEGKQDEAVALFQDALKVFPDYLPALNKLAESQMAQQKATEAEATFQHALQVSPKYPLAHIGLGMLLVNQKRYPEAIEHLDAAINLDESFPMAHLNLGVALLEKTPPTESDLERADKAFHKALALGGAQMVYAHKFLFNLHVRRRDYPRAIAALEAYLQAAPAASDAPQVQTMLEKVKKAAQAPSVKP